jgi:hypothetical protein
MVKRHIGKLKHAGASTHRKHFDLRGVALGM